jgi:hypothetical protein
VRFCGVEDGLNTKVRKGSQSHPRDSTADKLDEPTHRQENTGCYNGVKRMPRDFLSAVSSRVVARSHWQDDDMNFVLFTLGFESSGIKPSLRVNDFAPLQSLE